MASDDDATDTDDPSQIVREGIQEIDPGTIIDDRVILSRRQVMAVVGGSASLAGLLGLGAGSADAQQAAGQLGTSSEPVEAFLSNYGSESVSGGFELTIDGDVYEFNK